MFLDKSEGKGEGIGGVGVGDVGEVEHALHHFSDGMFLGGTVTDDGQLHFTWSDFENLESGFGDSGQDRSTRFAHDQGSLEVLSEKQAFDGAHGGVVFAQDIAQSLGNSDQATGAFPGRRAFDRSKSEAG